MRHGKRQRPADQPSSVRCQGAQPSVQCAETAGGGGTGMADLVGELELAEFDLTGEGLTGDAYHRRLAAASENGWLVRSPIAGVVLERDAGEFFLRARPTAFPAPEIATLFRFTPGPLAGQMVAN